MPERSHTNYIMTFVINRKKITRTHSHTLTLEFIHRDRFVVYFLLHDENQIKIEIHFIQIEEKKRRRENRCVHNSEIK